MPRLDEELPRSVFQGGPLHQTSQQKTAAGRWPIYRDAEGNRLRSDRAGARGARTGGVYQQQGPVRSRNHPAGSRLYRWIPPVERGELSS